ncbi:hypothetical protein GCM10022419_124420 [Nonomuraea rosea]|uniref:Core-binding (CB) domain-containing protein n=1 Tax=Nonomuraea rosea TaxID=638574 RepID=A0ABP6ZVJ0_9ACTN
MPQEEMTPANVVPIVAQLPTGQHLTVPAAADAFLDTLPNPNTVRAYAAGVGKIALRLGEHRPLAAVADDEIGEVLETLWGGAAVNTWNARRAAVLSWLAWCQQRSHTTPAVPAWAKRLAAPGSQTPPAPRPRSTGRGLAAGWAARCRVSVRSTAVGRLGPRWWRRSMRGQHERIGMQRRRKITSDGWKRCPATTAGCRSPLCQTAVIHGTDGSF